VIKGIDVGDPSDAMLVLREGLFLGVFD